MKILMATDGSKDATAAMIAATRLLRKKELQTEVLCVAPQLVLQGSVWRGTHRVPFWSFERNCWEENEQQNEPG